MLRRIKKIPLCFYNLSIRDIIKVDEDYGFYSQSGQDKYIVNDVFHEKRDGEFIDIGANDGITFSNTFYFEKELDWEGVAIEPLPDSFNKLKNNRNCILVEGCITEKNGETTFLAVDGYSEMLSGVTDKLDDKHLERIDKEIEQFGGHKKEITVKCYSLEYILDKHNISEIDYLSIDTEGYEYQILKNINFRKFKIKVISVENNDKSLKFQNFLRKKGFKLIAKAGSDEIFVNKKTI